MAPPVPGIKLNENGIPDFEDLPIRKGDPHLSAWGLYGDKDELGTLNRLTDERVAAAAKSEIRTGHRISLNWPIDAQPEESFFARQVFHQQLIRKDPRVINDDVWTFNSQVSTQWDGLRHFAYQREGLFYNGVTQDDIHGCGPDGKKSTVNGIHAWTDQGIVGRGILIDHHSWRQRQPPSSVTPYDSFSSLSIPLTELLACLASQDTVPRFGDILFIRSGFLATLPSKPSSFISSHRSVVPHHFGGVERSENILRWIWSNFSAVAGDQPSFESWPAPPDAPYALHEVLLAGWGCPVGELFDLEALAAHCESQKRWSFFVSSEPCNVPGGVASPPNVLAIF
ncbi:uncharacterized protein F4807DRAFT_9335 [Annulohypoxylon truncatum]|uniref:uncharacterized protein n=1 Tax=Annulohypoxylon truncatum TaxID=327061 RepID=UPI0020077FB1|nr:uncharacterized protein F4807DRAFT_9335 [Annulohypoxylon truncatum]KAI1214809.1 hypothetical protein F4807DRAFT_9335 [Annulohypoxylon truncatum]